MIRFLKSDRKTIVSRTDTIYLTAPHHGAHTVEKVWSSGVDGYCPHTSLDIKEVKKVEFRLPTGLVTVPISDVFFRKCDRDMATKALMAVQAVYESASGYETIRRKHKISKRRASVTVNMLDVLPDYTKKAMQAVCDQTMGGILPYCFTIQNLSVDNVMNFGDIKFNFDASKVPEPKLSTVYLRAPHGFGVAYRKGDISLVCKEVAFMSFLNWCGFLFDERDMSEIILQATYYRREYNGQKHISE